MTTTETISTDGIECLSFQEALERHQIIEDSITDLAAEHSKAVMDVWAELTGTGMPMSDASRAVRYGLPLEFAPLWRVMGNIPAAFYVAEFATAIKSRVEASELVDYTEIAGEALEALRARKDLAEKAELGWGYDRSAAWFLVLKVEELPTVTQEEIKKIVKLAGKMRREVDGWQPPLPTDAIPENVTGVTSGDELERLTPDEAASMGMDPEALVRVAEGFAQEYRMQGNRPSGAGPFVLLEDESGSMHRHRRVWAKAVGSTLIRIAHQEGRDVRVVHFSTATTLRDVPKNDPAALVGYLTSFLNGGTAIGKGLEVATREAVKKSTDATRADIVILTDGGDGDSARIKRSLDICDTANVKVWCCGICTDFSQAELATRSARYIFVSGSDANAASGGADDVADLLKDAAIDWSKRGEA
jgi:hypothetical protein